MRGAPRSLLALLLLSIAYAPSASALTFVIDFNDPDQPDVPAQFFGNSVGTFDPTGFGFAANQSGIIEAAVLRELRRDFLDIPTVATDSRSSIPLGFELDVDFELGDTFDAPVNGDSEFYSINVGSFASGTSTALGVAAGESARTVGGGVNQFGVANGAALASVFTDRLADIFPSSQDGNFESVVNTLNGTISHELSHTLSLDHVIVSSAVTPTPGAIPVQATGPTGLSNFDRIFDREISFSATGEDGQTLNNVAQLVNAVGLRPTFQVQIDAATGQATLFNSGDAFEITGYSIASASGAIDVAGFTGLNAAGFLPVDLSSTGIGEVSQVNQVLSDATPLPIGRIVSPLSFEFGELVDPNGLGEDFIVEVSTADGQVLPGRLEVVGFQRNTLVLSIDQETGRATVTNESQTPLSLQGYSITSSTGSLNPAALVGLAGEGFESALTSDENGIAELASPTIDGLTLAAGESFDLGLIFDPGVLEGSVDFDFTLLQPDDPLIGDFTDDGVVSAADFTLFRDTLGENTSLPNENTTPGSVTPEDFGAFFSGFGLALSDLPGSVNGFGGFIDYAGAGGAPAFATAAAAAVPEPGAGLCAMLGIVASAAGPAGRGWQRRRQA